jgi:hypothetical protein
MLPVHAFPTPFPRFTPRALDGWLYGHSLTTRLKLVTTPPRDLHLSLQTVTLVHTLERRDGLALVLVERVADDAAVAEVDGALRLLLETESVLHPVLVVALGVIFAGVRATRLLSRSSRDSSLCTKKASVSVAILEGQSSLTRKSTGSSAQGPQLDPSSRSCYGP